MKQVRINQAEWENPNNWYGPDWVAVYASKQDCRIWVPKKLRWMGWTLNLGRPAERCWLVGLTVATSTLIVTIVLTIQKILETVSL